MVVTVVVFELLELLHLFGRQHTAQLLLQVLLQFLHFSAPECPSYLFARGFELRAVRIALDALGFENLFDSSLLRLAQIQIARELLEV
jgi:hypothetical protein